MNLTNFMDGIDWMTVAEVLPVTVGLSLQHEAQRISINHELEQLARDEHGDRHTAGSGRAGAH